MNMATQRVAIWLLVIGLATVSAVHSAAASLDELPLGHLAFHERAQGTLNVEARCVPTEDLLKNLAQRAGEPLIFDIPVHNFVTVYEPWRSVSPQFWLSRVALLAGVRCDKVQGTWHVRAPMDVAIYNPSFTEDELKAQAPPLESVSQDVQPADQKCVLIVSGRWVPGPYRLQTRTGKDGELVTEVNGVSLQRLKPSNVRKGGDRPSPADATAKSQFDDIYAMETYVANTLYPSLLKGLGKVEAKRKVVDFLRSQQLIEEVLDPDTFTVRVKGTHYGRVMVPADYDFDTGTTDPRLQPLTPPGAPATVETVAARQLQHWEQSLNRDGVLIIGDRGSFVEMPGREGKARLGRILEQTEEATLLQRENLFYELVEDREMAREMATNMGPHFEGLRMALQRSVAERP